MVAGAVPAARAAATRAAQPGHDGPRDAGAPAPCWSRRWRSSAPRTPTARSRRRGPSRRRGTLLGVSTNTGVRFADVDAVGAPWWFQVYVMDDRAVTADARPAGRGRRRPRLVLTVDAPGGRPARARSSSRAPGRSATACRSTCPAATTGGTCSAARRNLCVDDIGWLRGLRGLPVVVKGVLRGDDAAALRRRGRRRRSSSRPTAAAASTGRSPRPTPCPRSSPRSATAAEVYVDSGLRTPEHVAAALCLGARAVFLGRPVLWALATGGDAAASRSCWAASTPSSSGCCARSASARWTSSGRTWWSDAMALRISHLSVRRPRRERPVALVGRGARLVGGPRGPEPPRPRGVPDLRPRRAAAAAVHRGARRQGGQEPPAPRPRPDRRARARPRSSGWSRWARPRSATTAATTEPAGSRSPTPRATRCACSRASSTGRTRTRTSCAETAGHAGPDRLAFRLWR